jgi:DNA-directed RNA polymerase specialized sigma subunit
MDGYDMIFPSEGLVGRTILGSVRFIKEINGILSEERVKKTKEIPRKQRYSSRKELDEIFQQEMIAGQNRNQIIYTAYKDYDYTMREIGEYLGLHYATISRVVKEYEKDRSTRLRIKRHI